METTNNKPTDDAKKPYSNQLNVGDPLRINLLGVCYVEHIEIVDVVSPTKTRVKIKLIQSGSAPESHSELSKTITINASVYYTPTGIAWS